MLWYVSFSFVLRQEAMDFIILPMVFCPIRPLVYQTSADLGRFMMLRQSGPVFFIPSGRSDNQSWNSFTGSLFPPSVLNMACGVFLRLMVRPPLRILLGPSRNSTTSVPSSGCLIITSSTYASQCSWRPRNPSCSVKFLKLTLVKTFSLKSPN